MTSPRSSSGVSRRIAARLPRSAPGWVPALSLGACLRKLGEDRYALTEAQSETLDGLFENERVLVKGGAGSGKTLLAAEAARREAGSGKRVLLLCFTLAELDSHAHNNRSATLVGARLGHRW